jgi:hypothetical protein
MRIENFVKEKNQILSVAAVIKFDAFCRSKSISIQFQFQFQFQFHFQFFLLTGKKIKGVTFTLNENQK